MLPADRVPTHPGEVVSEEFLKSLGLTQTALAQHLNVSVRLISETVRRKRGVTPETAWLLAGAFETTPNFWMDLQTAYDLVAAKPAGTITSLAKES